MLTDVDLGAATRNVTPDDALAIIERDGRSPLTIEEGIAVLLHDPEAVAPNAGFSLLGSRCGDRRVTALWISKGAPKLGWCCRQPAHVARVGVVRRPRLVQERLARAHERGALAQPPGERRLGMQPQGDVGEQLEVAGQAVEREVAGLEHAREPRHLLGEVDVALQAMTAQLRRCWLSCRHHAMPAGP